MTKQTKTDKIKILKDMCLGYYKQGLEDQTLINVMSCLFRVDGLLEGCDAIELPEVRQLIDNSEELQQFAEVCDRLMAGLEDQDEVAAE